jgi:hypothetical protein
VVDEVLVCSFHIAPAAEARQGDNGPDEFHPIFRNQRQSGEGGKGVLCLLPENPGPKVWLGGMHGNVDLDRSVGGQLFEECRLQHTGISRKAKRVVNKLPTNEAENLEEPRVEKGFPLGNSARKTIAEADRVVVGLHGTDLELDVLDVPKETADDREGVEIVGAEQAMSIADGTDGKLIDRAVTYEPFEYKWAESEGIILGPRRRRSHFRGRYEDARILRFCWFSCHCLTFA